MFKRTMYSTTSLLTTITLFIVASHDKTVASDQRPLLINIHQKTKEIKNQNECNPEQWNNNAEDSCECCLLQTQNQSDGQRNASNVFAGLKAGALAED